MHAAQGMLTLQDAQLLAQEQDFQILLLFGATCHEDKIQQEREKVCK